MLILLLNPPSDKLFLRDQYCSFLSKANYYWPPIDLLVQSGILYTKHQVVVLDAIIEKLSDTKCLERIQEIAPDVILSVTGISSFRTDFDFFLKLKQRLKVRLFLSGGFLLSKYENILKNHGIFDGILLNFTSYALLEYLDGKSNIKDLAYFDNEKLISELSYNKVVSYPTPRHELFKLTRYRLPHGKGGVFSCILTSHGCPYRCKFCIAQNIDYQQRTIEDVIEEIRYLKSLGVAEIYIKDFTFGIDKEWTKRLCVEIKKQDVSWICETRVDILNEEMLLLMRDAGCHTIQFGIETSTLELLKKYKEGISLEAIKKIFSLCKKYNISTLGHFIIGLPGETKSSAVETIRFAKKLQCDYASFNIATPLPGTDLSEECGTLNILPKDYEQKELDQTTGLSGINTPTLSSKELLKLKKMAYRRFYFRPTYILRRILKINGLNELRVLIREGIGVLTQNI